MINVVRFALLTLLTCTTSACAAEQSSSSCESFASRLSGAEGGDTLALAGDCDEITITKRFDKLVTVDASNAVVRGLRILGGSNVSWVGGVVSAPGGMDGSSKSGYAIHLRGAENVRISDVVITDANRGMVMDDARNVVLSGNRFWRLRTDGLISRNSVNVQVKGNQFSETVPVPTSCTMIDGSVLRGLAKRNCEGVWRDGTHSDAIQFYDGATNWKITGNTIRGDTQGIVNFGGKAPVHDIEIVGNDVAVTTGHTISVVECLGNCLVAGNKVSRGDPGRKAVIYEGNARRCGNDVEDERSDGKC